MKFQVKTINNQHEIEYHEIAAEDSADARVQFEKRGFTVTRVKRHNSFFVQKNSAHQSTQRRQQLHAFNIELFALLKAGLSLVESLEALAEKENNGTRATVLSRLILAIQNGKRFSLALQEQPAYFPPLYIGIIKASEETSDLTHALSRYIDFTQRGETIRSKVINAAIYPAILLFVGALVILFLVGYVVPRFSEVYRDAGRNLPWMSQMLLNWGHFYQANSIAILLACVVLGTMLTLFFLRHGTTPLKRLVGRIPLIRERMQLLELSRLYLTLGMLLEGGIAIVEAIAIVDSTVSADCKKKLAHAAFAIKQGETLSSAFFKNQLSTPISLRMLRVGENSGQMGLMLAQAAAFYETEIAAWIDRFSRAFEPLLMAAIGLIVGVIVVLLYMPIFDLAGSLS